MAELVSPGVSISVSDESFYAAAGAGTTAAGSPPAASLKAAGGHVACGAPLGAMATPQLSSRSFTMAAPTCLPALHPPHPRLQAAARHPPPPPSSRRRDC